jgi:ribA/ribD-fused uncharacterized protein
MAYIRFTAVNEPYGWMGNMYAAPINYEGETWLTSEALFQALRFNDKEIRELIRIKKSPMAAKMVAKSHREAMVVAPMSEEDLGNMRLCLRLKFSQHPNLRERLLRSGDHTIFEDVSARKGARHRFWGAVMINNTLEGENMLGRLLMELREELK